MCPIRQLSKRNDLQWSNLRLPDWTIHRHHHWSMHCLHWLRPSSPGQHLRLLFNLLPHKRWLCSLQGQFFLQCYAQSVRLLLRLLAGQQPMRCESNLPLWSRLEPTNLSLPMHSEWLLPCQQRLRRMPCQLLLDWNYLPVPGQLRHEWQHLHQCLWKQLVLEWNSLRLQSRI